MLRIHMSALKQTRKRERKVLTDNRMPTDTFRENEGTRKYLFCNYNN